MSKVRMPMILKSIDHIIGFRFISYRRSSFWWNIAEFGFITDTPHYGVPVSHQFSMHSW